MRTKYSIKYQSDVTISHAAFVLKY